MPMQGTAAVVIWCDIADDAIVAHDEWHSREHFPERIGIPGFLRGSRWVDPAGSPRYFILYEVTDLGVVTGRDYQARLDNPTPWTSKTMQSFRNMTRGYCRLVGGVGSGMGGTLTWLRFQPTAEEEPELLDRLVQHVLPEVASRPGIATAHLLQSAVEPPMTREQMIRGRDASVHCVLLVTTFGTQSAHTWCVDAAREGLLGEGAAGQATATGTHRLDYTLNVADISSVHDSGAKPR